MTTTNRILGLGCLGLCVTLALGATATFAPVGPTTVPPGTDVLFDVTLNVASLTSFDAADVVIGSPGATSLSFAYAPEWDSAFLNITGPLSNVGFYPHDVFVGGNNPSAVGTTLKIGTITLGTAGLPEGTYTVQISSAVDGGVSKLSRGDLRDPLSGSATFTIQCMAVDSDCDGDLDLMDYAGLPSCLAGPGLPVSIQCQRFDADADGDVDMNDWKTQMANFTGSNP